MWLAVWQPTPRTVDVTVTKIAGYVRILMNRWFFRIFGIHSFSLTATFYMPDMHALTLCLHLRCSRAVHACGALWLDGGYTWRHNNVGGVTAGQVRLNSSVNNDLGVNSPALVREIPHFGLFPAFLHFCQNVAHFWLYFKITKITENHNNF